MNGVMGSIKIKKINVKSKFEYGRKNNEELNIKWFGYVKYE